MAYVRTSRRAPAKRKVRSRRKRANPRFGRHRPVLIFGAGGWRRPKRSKMSPSKKTVRVNRKRRRTRLNPFTSASAKRAAYKRWYGTKYPSRSTRRRARRNPVYSRRRRTYRRNPGFKALGRTFNRQFINTALQFSGGMVAGFAVTPFVYGLLPAGKATPKIIPDKYLGFVHIALGAILIGFVRNKMAKTIGVGIAGAGAYDLLAMNLPDAGIDLNLPPLPRTSPFASGILPAKTESVDASYSTARRPISATARGISASYRPRSLAASYPGNMRPVGMSGSMSYDEPFSDD